jgi:septal ring factor EnvC (AmiA/AmiB activator)
MGPPRSVGRKAVLVAACLVVAVLASAEQPTRDTRLRAMRAEIRRLEVELEELRRRESGLLGQLERLDAELRLREAEIGETSLRLEGTRAAIDERTAGLDRLEQAQDERRSYLAFRLREIYKAGPDQALRVMIGGDELDRYWSGLRYAAFLSERDGRVLRSYRRDTRRLDKERQGLLAEERRLKATRVELSGARRRLASSRQQRVALLDRIRRDADTRETALGELRAATAELTRLVDRLAPAPSGLALDVSKFRGLLDWPADGPVSSGFGSSVHPRFKTRVPHPGLDIDAEFGAGIRSVFDGRVVFGSWLRGYGLTVIVDHGGGLLSVYAHASALLVEAGQEVARGQRLGTVGDTGSLRGPYLYFELRDQGRPIDPTDWLRPR